MFMLHDLARAHAAGASFAIAVIAALSGPAISQVVQGPEASAELHNPGPKPANVLPDILASLRKTMKDPYSIRDLRLCEPKVAPAFKYPGAGERWEPAKWTVAFELNAKNGFGAYTGRTYFAATYKAGKLDDVGSPNLGAELNGKLLSITESCPRVPNVEIQAFLEK